MVLYIIKLFKNLPGPFLFLVCKLQVKCTSGYKSPLYEDAVAGWYTSDTSGKQTTTAVSMTQAVRTMPWDTRCCWETLPYFEQLNITSLCKIQIKCHLYGAFLRTDNNRHNCYCTPGQLCRQPVLHTILPAPFNLSQEFCNS